MNEKVSFGFDYLYMMLNAHIRSVNQNDVNGYNLARMFLITSWGLTLDEQDEANQLINQAINDKSLWGENEVASRIVSQLKKIQPQK